jgi:hypothetical protein
MAGGILQLVAKSQDDIYLINDPQITLFKIVYRRYSNFSIDNKNLRFNKNISFNSKGVCNIKKYGDLLHKLYLVINLPDIDMIYQALTYDDVYNILLTAGINWEYIGEPTDKVKISDLSNIYETIINAMNDYEQNIAIIQINNLLPLNELYNYYLNNNIDDQSGITFTHNYIGGIDTFEGIIYNKINGEPIDSSITQSIISEFNFTESYKKDKCNLEILNLNTLQPIVHDLYQNFILYPNYNYSYTGDISSTTVSSITLTNNDILTDLSYNYFKNSYINTGIQLSLIDIYDNNNNICELLNDQQYLPDIVNQEYNIINTPTDYTNGVIYDKKKVISPYKFPYYNTYNYYQNWLGILYDNIDSDHANDIGTLILNYDNNNYIVDLSNISNPVYPNPGNPSELWYRQYLYLTKNYIKAIITDIVQIPGFFTNIQTDVSLNIVINQSNFYIFTYFIVHNNKLINIYNSFLYPSYYTMVPNFDIQLGDTIYAFNFIKTVTETFLENNVSIDYIANPQITNIQHNIVIHNNIEAHIYDASSTTSTNLLLDINKNPYVKFLDLSNNIILSNPPDPIIQSSKTNIIECNIIDISYNNIFSYEDLSNNIPNYENMYLLYQNELHQINSSNTDSSNISFTLKDIFNYDNSYNETNFIIIKNINSFYDTSGTSGSTIELIDISGMNVVNKKLYYNNQITTISSIVGNTVTINPILTNMPKYLDTCYIIDESSIVTKTNIQNINISRTTEITLDIDFNPNDYNYFVSNHKIYDISSTSYGKIYIETDTNINLSNNVSNYLITDLDISSTITDVTGNTILCANNEGTGTLPYINGDISGNKYWSLIYGNQNYTLTNTITDTGITNPIYFNLDKKVIRMPQIDDLYTITLRIEIDVSDTLHLPKNNLIVCINDESNIDYTDYNISINNQLIKIKYYDLTYKLCVLDNKLIFLNNELINANCLLFNNTSISLNSLLRNDSNIIYENNEFDYIVYLNILSSSEINFYNNWYIEIIQNNYSELHKIIFYDNINKIAYLETNFINGPPPANSAYNLYENINFINRKTLKLPNNVFSISLLNNTETFNNSILNMKNESATISYFDNYNCIVQSQFAQFFDIDTSLNIINQLQEMYKYDYDDDSFKNALKLQKYKLNTDDDYYNNMYINIGSETHEIISYDGTNNNINIDISWTNIDDISNNYNIYDDAFNTNLIMSGIITQPYQTGVYLANNNLNSTRYFYNNNFLQINNRIYQINIYFNDTTYVIIDTDQSIDVSNIIIDNTEFNLFSRLLLNVEIGNINDISDNIITLDVQSSKINKYYNNWLIDISNVSYYITSYNSDKLQATISGIILETSDVYKLYNNFIENNCIFYNTIYLSNSLINNNMNYTLHNVFDSIISENLPSTITNCDFYKIYNIYTQINNFDKINISTVNFNNIKIYLLTYLYDSFINNINQIKNIFELLLNTNFFKDPHYMFLFNYEFGTSKKTFNNTSLNLPSNDINLINDNFTNQIKTINTSFYSDYVNTSVMNFHFNNQNIHNNNFFIDYYSDQLIWKRSGILIDDVSNTYLLNYVPLIVGNDICTLIKSRLLNNNTDTIFIDNLFNYLLNINTDMLIILNKNIILTNDDINYIEQFIIPLNKITLINLFKPYNSFYIDVDLEMLNEYNIKDVLYNKLSPIQYICYNLLYNAYYYTINNYNGQDIINILKIISDACYTFLMTPDKLPIYSNYKINNYKLQSSDPSNLSNILSSIWNYINTNLIISFNNLYAEILNIEYYTNELGDYSKQLLYRCFDLLNVDINNDIIDYYYYYDYQKINKIIMIITDELNKFNLLYNKNINYNNILNVKFTEVDKNIYYYNNILNTYNGIQSTINMYININDPYYDFILNGTINILSQLYKCTFDIIGDISNYTINTNNYINTFFYSDVSTNPFNQLNEPNLYLWYDTYYLDISQNEFIEIMNNISNVTLYNDKINIDAFYNNFKTDKNVIQYIADIISKKTNLINLFYYTKNNWLNTYNNLLQYFNKEIIKYNNYLTKIGYKNDPPTMYNEINQAVTNQTPYFAWIKYLGYYLIDYCSITIGGCEMDKHTGEYMMINNTIDNDINKTNGLNHMIGHLPELYTYDSNKKKSLNLYIPLNYWFYKDSGHALPLIAMNYTGIDLNLSLKKLEDVAYWSKFSIFKKKPLIKTSVIAQYIYLDENERNIISKSKHEQLIENIQYVTYIYSYRDIKNNSIKPYLYFNNMCKEIIWSIQPDNNYINYNNIDGFEPKWYEYGFNNGTINTHVKGVYIWDISNNTTYFDASNNPSTWKSNNGTTDDISGNILPLKYILNSNNYDTPHNNLYYDSSGNLYDDTNSLILYNHFLDLSDNVYNLDSYICDSSINYINPSKNITINMNGNHREEIKDYMYYNYVQSNVRHKTSLPNGIYSYSFAIHPKIFQPSGALNLSKIENLNFVIELNSDLIQAMKNNNIKIKCSFYIKSFNIVRTMSGMSGLAFFG